MRSVLLAAVAALCLAACNSKPGPEQTTPAEFGEVTFYPTVVTPETKVTVSVPVTSQYGLTSVYIVYMRNEDPSDVKFTAPKYLTREITSLTYEGTIPEQKAGTKVTFQVCALTAYNVPSFSQIKEYTVPEEPDGEGGGQPE